MKRAWVLSLAIPLIAMVFHFLSDGSVLTAGNLNNVFKYLTVVGLLSAGMTVVMAAGFIDLSVGSTLGFLGAVAALLLAKGLPLPLALGISLVAAIAIGLVHGAMVAFLRVPAFIATLGGLMAYMGGKQLLANPVIPIRDPFLLFLGQGYLNTFWTWGVTGVIVTGWLVWQSLRWSKDRKSDADTHIPFFHKLYPNFIFCGGAVGLAFLFVHDRGMPVCFLLLLVALSCAHVLTQKMRFGRHAYAMGSQREAALYAGLPLNRLTLGAFVVMGIFAWLAGLVATSQLMAAAADIGDYQELYAIAACVIGGTSLMGGTGHVWMSLLGALLMASILNGMEQVGLPSTWQKMILGLILVLAVALDQWAARREGTS
jgi:D-xylose transport system permease protein